MANKQKQPWNLFAHREVEGHGAHRLEHPDEYWKKKEEKRKKKEKRNRRKKVDEVNFSTLFPQREEDEKQNKWSPFTDNPDDDPIEDFPEWIVIPSRWLTRKLKPYMPEEKPRSGYGGPRG